MYHYICINGERKFTYQKICINGELKRFFPRSKGVARGDPMLPYLLVLVMEVFSRLMDRMFKRT